MSDPLFPVAILAGGLATRLGPLTHSTPKALIDINGQPFVFHQLSRLSSEGVHKVVFCLGHLGERVVEAVSDGQRFGLHVDYSFDAPTLLGTAGAVKKALPKLGNAFFVLYGDSYLDCNYQAVQHHFLSSGKPGLMTLFRNEHRWDRSNVEFSKGRILAYDKENSSPRMRHIDYGLGVFQKDAFGLIEDNTRYDLGRLYQQLLQGDQLAALEVFARFYEVGSPEGLEEIRRHLTI